MQAIILAAGVGQRLGVGHPKCLLSFCGRTLLERHLDNLRRFGVDDIIIVTGHMAASVQTAVPEDHASTIRFAHNDRYTDGSAISLLCGLAAVDVCKDVLIMDADVLYDPLILGKLIEHNDTALLYDRHFEPGDEPVKVCLHEDRIVAFSKQLSAGLEYDRIGESVGFFHFAVKDLEQLQQTLATSCRG